MLGFAPLASEPIGSIEFDSIAIILGSATTDFVTEIPVAAITGSTTVTATPRTIFELSIDQTAPAAQMGYSYAQVIKDLTFVNSSIFGDYTGSVDLLGYPSGTQKGDLVFLWIAWDESPGSSFLTPDGWTVTRTDTSSETRSQLWRRSAPASQNFFPLTLASGDRHGGFPFLFTFSGGEYEEIVENNGTTEEISFGTVTVDKAGSTVLNLIAVSSVEVSFTSGFGLGAEGDDGTGIAYLAADIDTSVAAGDYTRAAVTPTYPSGTSGLNWRSYSIVIAPRPYDPDAQAQMVMPLPTVNATISITRNATGLNVMPFPFVAGSGLRLRAGRRVDVASAGPTLTREANSTTTAALNNSENSVTIQPIDSSKVT